MKIKVIKTNDDGFLGTEPEMKIKQYTLEEKMNGLNLKIGEIGYHYLEDLNLETP